MTPGSKGLRHHMLLMIYTRIVPSAGVGRTGVFVALSIVLERMRYEGVVDLFQTVKLLRTQRQGMIQSEVFIRMCLCTVYE